MQRYKQRLVDFGPPTLFFFVMMLGGAGTHLPVLTLVDDLVLLAVLAWCLVAMPADVPRGHAPVIRWIAVATILLFALQLLPVPYGMWSALAGREAAVAAWQSAGLPANWHPLSLDPGATEAQAVALLAAVTGFVVIARLPLDRRITILRFVVAAAAASALLGVLQFFAPDARVLYLVPVRRLNPASGFFANGNHQAIFLVVMMPITAALAGFARSSRAPQRIWWQQPEMAVVALFGVVAIMTWSRAGILFSIPAAMLSAAIALRRPSIFRAVLALTIAGFVAAALVAYLRPDWLASLGGLSEVDQDLRLRAWPDLMYAAHTYLPWGSGGGTFVPVFNAAESLDILRPTYLNHAHNEYVEIAIEYGIPGIALIVALLGWVVWRGVAIERLGDAGPYQDLQRACFAGLTLLAAHSIVDYPLRTTALMLIAGIFLGMLATITSVVPRAGATRTGGKRIRQPRA